MSIPPGPKENPSSGIGPIMMQKESHMSPDEETRWRNLINQRIVRMLTVPDLTQRRQLYESSQLINNFYGDEGSGIDLGNIQPVLNLIGADKRRVPLLGQVWAIISLSKAANQMSEEQLRELKVWEHIEEAILSDPDPYNIDYMILAGSFLAGLSLSRENPGQEFARLKRLIEQLSPNPVNLFGIGVAVNTLSTYINADQLRLGILSTKIQGGDKQESTSIEKTGGVPDTVMILTPGDLSSLKKLREGVVIGVPTAGRLEPRVLDAMVGIQREIPQSSLGSSLKAYPDRRWTYITLGSFIESESPLPTGVFVADMLTCWIAVRALDNLKGKISHPTAITNAVKREIIQLDRPIEYHILGDNQIKKHPGIIEAAVCEYLDKVGIDYSSEIKNKAVKQLTQSAVNLLIAASEDKSEKGFLISDRYKVIAAFMEEVFRVIPEEDKAVFNRIKAQLQTLKETLILRFETVRDKAGELHLISPENLINEKS